jgi:transposase
MSKKINLILHDTPEQWQEKIRNIKDNGDKLKMLVIEKILSNPNISGKEIQQTFFISKKIMFKWIKQYNENGLESLTAKKQESRGSGKGRTKIDDSVYKKLKAEIEQNPDKKWTLKAKQEYIEKECGVRVTQQAIAYRMKRDK